MTPRVTDINIIRERFSQSRGTYNREAVVQREIAERLAGKICKIAGLKHDRILEIGSGTGFLTDKILTFLKPSQYFINDLSESMQPDIEKIARAHKFNNYSFIPGDAEEQLFPGGLDFVVSASTFQWFNNLSQFFNKISGLMNEGGYIAFSTFGNDNFKEIRTTLDVGLNYLPAERIVDILTEKFSVVEVDEWVQKQYFSSPFEVLKHMKNTGVNSVVSNFIGKSKLNIFTEEYRKIFSALNGAVSLTYHPIIIIAKKRSTN
jgi:malonyl-ACP O-methyltransferase BioC